MNLGYTKITSADVSKLKNLENLQLYGTDITSIDLSNNTKLAHLSLSGCSKITYVDLTNNKKLQHIQLQSSGINDFQISGYSELEEVWLTYCIIEKVRITNCPNLTRLVCPMGTSAFDISGCTSLQSVDISELKSTLYSFKADNSGLRGVIDLSYCTYLQEVSMNNCTGIVGINVADCYSLSTLSVTDSSALYVNADNCLALWTAEVSDNVYKVVYGTETVDFRSVEGFGIYKVTVISGGKYSDGVFYFDEGSKMIVYNYFLSNNVYGQFIIEYN